MLAMGRARAHLPCRTRAWHLVRPSHSDLYTKAELSQGGFRRGPDPEQCSGWSYGARRFFSGLEPWAGDMHTFNSRINNRALQTVDRRDGLHARGGTKWGWTEALTEQLWAFSCSAADIQSRAFSRHQPPQQKHGGKPRKSLGLKLAADLVLTGPGCRNPAQTCQH